jgi:tRNA threonylcarbamoyladenosine biosynthesis protein TsaE
MFIEVKSEDEMKALGKTIGALLQGGEVIELIGDVQSPSFTICRVYKGRNKINLAHYDFYRLDGAGIMADELQEVAGDHGTVMIIEWGGVVEGVLPMDRLSVQITVSSETSRKLTFVSGGDTSRKLKEQLTS